MLVGLTAEVTNAVVYIKGNMILIFDTETTNFVSNELAPDHPRQAHIVQLAWLLLDFDFHEIACFKSIISVPEGTYMSEGALEKHKITVELSRKCGIAENIALFCFWEAYAKSTWSIAFNHKFDKSIINLAHRRSIVPGATPEWDSGERCVMEAMTPLCCLPFASGKRAFGQKYKWPKLEEAHEYAFGVKFDGAHDALADVRATGRILKWLCDNKHLTLNE